MIVATSLLERRAEASDRYIHVGSRATSLLRSVQQRCSDDHAPNILAILGERQLPGVALRIRKVGAIVADYLEETRKEQ